MQKKPLEGIESFRNDCLDCPELFIPPRKNSVVCTISDSQFLRHEKTTLRFAGAKDISCAWLLFLSEPAITQ